MSLRPDHAATVPTPSVWAISCRAVRVEMEPLETVVTGQFLDAATGFPIENRAVMVKIFGENSDKVTDFANQTVTEFKVSGGFLSFSLLKDFVPTRWNPARLTLVTHAEGYTSGNVKVNITKSESF